MQELGEDFVYIDFYRVVSIDGSQCIRADRASSILSKCRETIINWEDDSQIIFKDGTPAPVMNENFDPELRIQKNLNFVQN